MMMAPKRVFEQYHDQNHSAVFQEYHELNELLDYQGHELEKEELEAIRLRLQAMIKKQPDYLDPYLLLCDVYMREGHERRADQALERAYQRALRLILDKVGRWPDLIPWTHLDNRPIVRALLKKAGQLWHAGTVDPESWRQAFAIHENILRTNPNDNIGVRYHLLAMLERMSPDEFDRRFTAWEPYAGEVSNGKDVEWFEVNAKRHPELRWWLKYAKSQGW